MMRITTHNREIEIRPSVWREVERLDITYKMWWGNPDLGMLGHNYVLLPANYLGVL